MCVAGRRERGGGGGGGLNGVVGGLIRQGCFFSNVLLQKISIPLSRKVFWFESPHPRIKLLVRIVGLTFISLTPFMASPIV